MVFDDIFAKMTVFICTVTVHSYVIMYSTMKIFLKEVRKRICCVFRVLNKDIIIEQVKETNCFGFGFRFNALNDCTSIINGESRTPASPNLCGFSRITAVPFVKEVITAVHHG